MDKELAMKESVHVIVVIQVQIVKRKNHVVTKKALPVVNNLKREVIAIKIIDIIVT